VSHALLRGALSRLVDRSPEQWLFGLNAYGKPHLANPDPNLDIQFNLSHTHGLAVLALAINREVGIDVENLDRQESNTDIAERFFAPEEVSELISQPQDKQPVRFLEYWTLKESYIKAIGMGLSCPLESFAFQPGVLQQAPRLLRVDDPVLSQKKWTFWQEQIGLQHLVALCVQSGTETQFKPAINRADWLYAKR
jgi:4'-phosphopantetheinyl transferase